LDEATGYVFHTDLEAYISQAVSKEDDTSAAPKWEKILLPKSEGDYQKPFMIASFGS